MQSRVDESRELHTHIVKSEAVVILPKPQVEGAAAEEGFVDCVGGGLAGRGDSAIAVRRHQEFVDSTFPWFEPGTAPSRPEAIEQLLTRPGLAEKVAASHVRYIVWMDGGSRKTDGGGSIACGAAPGAAGCASSPPGHGAGQGQGGGAGSPAPSASPAGSAAPSDAAKPDAAGAGAASGGGGTGSAQTSGPDGPGQTSDERRAGLDKRLDDSLGSFDAELRTEQQRVAQERDTRRAAAAGSAAAEGQGADKSADKSADTSGTAGTEVPAHGVKPGGTHRRGDASRRRDTSGDLKSEKASKKPDDNAGNGASAREIARRGDDDVVARRLRQAAEQETDPELKEKLWQEYIDYKRNAQGK